jgi:hypothetical protein
MNYYTICQQGIILSPAGSLFETEGGLGENIPCVRDPAKFVKQKLEKYYSILTSTAD